MMPRPVALMCAATLLVLASCAAFAPTDKFTASPEQHGLVIVGGTLVEPLKGWSKLLARGATEDVRPAQEGRLASSATGRLEGIGAAEGWVAFLTPQPGTYRLAGLGYADGNDRTRYISILEIPESAYHEYPRLETQVGAGEVIYMGRVMLHYQPARFGQEAVTLGVQWDAAPESERAALQAVLGAMKPGNPWAPILQRRIDALKP